MVGRVSIQAPTRQPTITVAAANSSARAKRAAAFVCDGTDDQEQIQAAIDRASDDRGRVLLLGGDFLVRGTINLESNVTLEGVGPDSVIRLADGYSLDQYTWRVRVHTPIVLADGKENVTVRNLRVTGNATQYEARAQVGIAFHDCDHCLAEDCHADAINYFPAQVVNSNNGGYGIGTFESRHITIRGGRYEGSGYENLRVDFKSKHILVDGVFCGGGNRTSLQVITGSKHVRVVNSTIIQDDPNSFSAITIHAGIAQAGGESVEDVTVVGCTILATLAVGQDYAINIITNDAASAAKNIRFVNNYITCNVTAIRIRGQYFVFRNNWIIAGGKGIVCSDATSDVKIEKNVILCGGSGIRMSDNGVSISIPRVEIVGNEIEGGESPVVSLRNNPGASGWRIDRNIVRSSVANAIGINVFGGTSAFVGTSCVGNKVSVQGPGIRIASGIGGSADWIVKDNDVTGTAGIELLTGVHRYRDNIGYVTSANGTATVASGDTSIVVTHGLARTPALKDISVTPTNSLGDATKFWTSTPTSTQFTIHVDADPGVTTATFAWSAEIKP